MAVTMRISHLIFSSPYKEAATIHFGSGLNLIYGPSNTGKSSIYDAIDFMFGRIRKLKEIPEHEGYQCILLGLEFSNSESFTLVRDLSGGDIKCFDGLKEEVIDEQDHIILKLKDKTKKVSSLPDFILEKLSLNNKHLKKNERNETVRLTLRNFLPLFFINETNIQQENSPYIGQQFTNKSTDKSRLKLLLTGVDDSALIPEERERQRYSREAQIQLLSEFIEDQKDKISDAIPEHNTFDDLEDQNAKLEVTLRGEANELLSTESEYREHVSSRNKLRDNLIQNEQRSAEIDEMLGRFKLLKEQYSTDNLRLENIIEAGTLFGGLPLSKKCPVCGADTEYQRTHDHCDTDAEEVILAARSERHKIINLNEELKGVVDKLHKESETLRSELPAALKRLSKFEEKIRFISPIVIVQRSQYSEILASKSRVEKTIGLFEDLDRLEEKQKEIEQVVPVQLNGEVSQIQLPTHSLFELSQKVGEFLKTWEFAESPNVHFDKEINDFVIDGKLRTSNGSGHRAITHAAATLALLGYTEDKDLPYPGVVLLDSPLLAYEKPENAADDLSGTDVNLRFFEDLEKWDSRQIIVFEHKKSIPSEYEEGSQITHFTKSNFGRYGFFPVTND